MELENVISLEELEKKGKSIFKKGNKQIAIFKTDNDIFAIDNRCPHEGYPLLQGTHDEKCVLTCNWHNWKFDMKTGECLTGGDNVRTYPIVIKDNQVFLELTEPTKEDIEKEIIKGLKTGFEKRQYGRISRELARLHFNNIDMKIALKKAIEWSYNKLEDGTNHSYAVAADWFKLFFETDEIQNKISYLTEIIDYIALESLRQPDFSFTKNKKLWDSELFLESISKEDENTSIELINGAYDSGLHFKDIEKTITEAALMHYNDFGHSLIYVQKTSYLINNLGNEIEHFLTLALTRSIIKATKEDLLPEFKNYDYFLSKMNSKNTNTTNNIDFYLKNIQESMKIVTANFSKDNIKSIYEELLKSNSKNLLYFNIDYQFMTDNKVSENIGWLDFTHAITFSNAVREQCSKYPELWKFGLIQMACFSGRNVNHLEKNLDEKKYYVTDYNKFKLDFLEMISDHGITAPIYPAHLLKTAIAIFDEFENSDNEELKKYLLASLNRFLNSNIKQKHMKRTIKQSIDLVSLDFK